MCFQEGDTSAWVGQEVRSQVALLPHVLTLRRPWPALGDPWQDSLSLLHPQNPAVSGSSLPPHSLTPRAPFFNGHSAGF